MTPEQCREIAMESIKAGLLIPPSSPERDTSTTYRNVRKEQREREKWKKIFEEEERKSNGAR